MTQRLAFVVLAFAALAAGLVLFVRSRAATTPTFAWREGFPDRLLYESAPSTLFPTARTTALGRRVDVDYGNGMSIRIELTESEPDALALARRWFDSDKASASTSTETASGFESTSSATPATHARIVTIGNATIRTAGTHRDDPGRLLTWIPGLQHGVVEDPIASLRRDRSVLFWSSIVVAGLVAAYGLGRAARAHAVPR